MNSSGIKRGLAVSAVSALAVVGIPALANSASAAVGESFTVVSSGPALNGGTEGAVVILRAKTGTITPALIKAVGTSGTTVGTEDSADQDVEVESATSLGADPSDATFELIEVRIAVTTTAVGSTASFRLFEDDGATSGTLEASEARQGASISTAGPLAKIVIAPASQSTPQGIESGAYTVTLQDSAGRTTQLAAGDVINIDDASPVEVTETGDRTATAGDDVLTSDELATGTDTFTANPSGAAVGTYNIKLTDDDTAAITSTATLKVTAAADLTKDEVDIVTGADSWDGFGGDNFGGTTLVRVDQGTIRIDIDADASDANSTVRLNLAGTGVTFGGKATTNLTTVLDADGKGSLVITPDAGTVQDGDTIDITGAFTETLEFDRANVTDIVPTSDVYFSKVGGSVDVTVKVVDQFGLPITSGFVTAARDDENAAADATPQRKAVGADGTATFTFTDTKAVNGGSEHVDVNYYKDQFTPADSPDFSEDNVAEIRYTTDGMGANYVVSLDGKNTEATGYKASDVSVVPLADADADDDNGTNESVDLVVDGGEPGASVTISVDNGALILAPSKSDLSDGKSSVTASLDAVTGALPSGYRIVGTKSGVVTVTTTAAGRTETAQFTVAAETDLTTARNVTVSGPAEVEHGTSQITYTAVVTDAFGNPVVGFPRAFFGTELLNVQVSGPGQLKDSDTQTDASGALKLNVAVQPGAEGDVTIQVKGVSNAFFGGDVDQFGAKANRLTATSATDDAKGLPVSSDVATATTTVKAAPVGPTPVDAGLVVSGKGGKIDRVKANAIDESAGAKATLWVGGKKVKTGTLNSAGDFTFRVKDKNGNKKTKYTVKIGATTLTLADSASKRIR